MAKMTWNDHPVVSPQDWLTARKALLKREKEFTRAREELAQARRDLPWERTAGTYVFQGLKGEESLSMLFGRKRQLIVYHFMFHPDWNVGCAHCSFWADHFSAMLPHLEEKNAKLVVVSRAPMDKIKKFKKRMGWEFKWVSDSQGYFSRDHQVYFPQEDLERGPVVYNYQKGQQEIQDREGLSVFCRDKSGAIFHTYSAYARGIDMVNTTYQFLDLLPQGRDEDEDEPQAWVRHHDKYG